MILIINICKNEMHYNEFVRPIEDVLKSMEEPFITKHYTELSKKDMKKIIDSSHRIIIPGTSLADMSYTKSISKFKFLLSYNKPVLAICGGMQLLCMIHGCKLIKFQEIGLKKITFNAEYLGINGDREVYELHNNGIKEDAVFKKNFNVYSKTIKDAKNACVQAVKHKHFKHYGVLFHPEVRNKDLIKNFLSV